MTSIRRPRMHFLHSNSAGQRFESARRLQIRKSPGATRFCPVFSYHVSHGDGHAQTVLTKSEHGSCLATAYFELGIPCGSDSRDSGLLGFCALRSLWLCVVLEADEVGDHSGVVARQSDGRLRSDHRLASARRKSRAQSGLGSWLSRSAKEIQMPCAMPS